MSAKAPPTPPHSHDAEVAVIGSILLAPHEAQPVFDLLEPAAFYDPRHRAIFETLVEMRAEAQPFDIVLLGTELTRRGRHQVAGGSAYLSELLAAVPSAANLTPYAAIVREFAARRALIETLTAMADSAAGGSDLAEIRQRLDGCGRAIEKARTPRSDDTVAISAADLRTLVDAGGLAPRAVFAGVFPRGEVSAIGGGTGAGKSGLLWELAGAATAFESYTWVRWPIEPHPEGRRYRVGLVLGENDRGEVVEFLEKHLGVGRWPENLTIFECIAQEDPPDLGTPTGLDWLERNIRRYALDVVILDNVMSLVMGDHNSNELAQPVMRRLRRIARLTGVTILLAIHTSKAGANGDQRRSVEKLFGSVYWANFASTVVLVEHECDTRGRPEEESFRRILRHAKARGPRFEATIVEFDPETRRFESRGLLGQSSVTDEDERARVPLSAFRELMADGAPRTKEQICASLDLSRSGFEKALQRWSNALRDELVEEDGKPPHGKKTYRLRSLEERSGNGGAADRRAS